MPDLVKVNGNAQLIQTACDQMVARPQSLELVYLHELPVTNAVSDLVRKASFVRECADHIVDGAR